MSLRNLRYWMNRASGSTYAGPTKAAVLLNDGTVIKDIPLTPWRAGYDALNAIDAEKVAATFTEAQKGGWCGEARVQGATGGFHNIYTRDGSTIDAAVADMTAKLHTHNTRIHALDTDPTTKLDVMLAATDWYAHISDDHAVWSGGERHSRATRDLMAQVPVETARALFAKHAPSNFACPV